MANLSTLPPPPKGQTGVSPDQFSHLPPPPQGQQGMTLDQINQPSQPTQSTGFLGGIGNTIKGAFQSGVNQIKSGFDQVKNTTTSNPLSLLGTGIEAGAKVGAGAINAAMSPIAPVMAPVGKAIGAVTNKISDNPSVQKFAMSPAGQATARGAEDVGNLNTIFGAATTLEGRQQIGDAVKQGTENAQDTMSQLTSKSPQEVNNDINSYYQKAIKPGLGGRTNATQIENYNLKVPQAIKSIADNVDNLSFKDEFGNVETGRLPQSPAELADAVDQTKANIFKQYDALAQQAGDNGIKVSTEPLANQLDKVINNEAIKVANPQAIQYAQALKDRLTQTVEDGSPNGLYKEFDPQTTQDIVKSFNESLDAFYKNPNYDTASKAAIDAGVVRTLREELDKGISNSTGADYQDLKNQYGALSAIEKDVAKRAVLLQRQGGNASGLGKYVDIFSGGDMANGVLSLNPGLFAKGAAQAGLSKFFQWVNSPDRAIGKMFDVASQPATPPINMQSGFIKNPFGEAVAAPEQTVEAASEQNSGWQSGMKVKFDTALNHGDAAAVSKMLPDIPPDYAKAFKGNIDKVLNADQGASAINSVPENDWKFLTKFADNVKNKVDIAKKDYEMVKSILKENKLEVPQTARKTADFINTANESASQKSLDAEMNTNMSKTFTSKAQPRDKVGRFDIKPKNK